MAISEKGSKQCEFRKEKAFVVCDYFINEKEFILEVIVQGEGALGKQTKRDQGPAEENSM